MKMRRDRAIYLIWLIGAKLLGTAVPRVSTRTAISFYRRTRMSIGKPTYVAHDVWFDGTDNYGHITVEDNSTISMGVRVLTHDWAPSRTLWSLGRTDRTPVGRIAPVVIGEYAFIGMGAILMPGATIGRGAIVGAGAVVRGAVPDYGIVIGNPATLVGDARDYVRTTFPDAWAELPERVDLSRTERSRTAST